MNNNCKNNNWGSSLEDSPKFRFIDIELVDIRKCVFVDLKLYKLNDFWLLKMIGL